MINNKKNIFMQLIFKNAVVANLAAEKKIAQMRCVYDIVAKLDNASKMQYTYIQQALL